MSSIHGDSHPARSREAGVALLASVLLLLMLATIGLASLNVVERDQQVAGYLNRKAIALHAADAAIANAQSTLVVNHIPSVPVTTMGDSSMYPNGQPSYRPDPTAAQPFEMAGTGACTGCGLTGGTGGAGAAYSVQFWKIRVQGEAPGGSIARVEVLTGNVVSTL